MILLRKRSLNRKRQKKFLEVLNHHMIKITNAELHNLNSEFSRFKARITQSRKQDNTYFVSQLSQFEKKYKKAGLANSFAVNMFDFAEKMHKIGIPDFPGIIFSNLMKMPFLKPQVKEQYAIKGLEYAEEQGDSIHVLARLVDLEKIYKQNKDTHKYTRVLFKQEKVLINICNDFKGAKRNFKTYSRSHSQLKQYEMELAKTRVDIAKVILKTNPKQAKIILEKAKTIFEREGRQKEVDFTDLLLSEIAAI